jgi:hypothetical protein
VNAESFSQSGHLENFGDTSDKCWNEWTEQNTAAECFYTVPSMHFDPRNIGMLLIATVLQDLDGWVRKWSGRWSRRCFLPSSQGTIVPNRSSQPNRLRVHVSPARPHVDRLPRTRSFFSSRLTPPRARAYFSSWAARLCALWPSQQGSDRADQRRERPSPGGSVIFSLSLSHPTISWAILLQWTKPFYSSELSHFCYIFLVIFMIFVTVT